MSRQSTEDLIAEARDVLSRPIRADHESEEARGVVQRLADALEAAEHAADEIEKLRGWKAEAMDVLSEWEKTWIAAGRPGRLGTSKAAGVREEIERLRGEGEWEYALQADGDDEPWSDWYESRELLADNLDALAARDDERLVRRRKAGPWEPVEEDGDA